MDGQHQDMIVRTEAEAARTEAIGPRRDRTAAPSVRARGPGLREVDRLGREVDNPGWIDDLDSDAVRRGEAGPQSLVAPHDLVSAADNTSESSGPLSRKASEML